MDGAKKLKMLFLVAIAAFAAVAGGCEQKKYKRLYEQTLLEKETLEGNLQATQKELADLETTVNRLQAQVDAKDRQISQLESQLKAKPTPAVAAKPTNPFGPNFDVIYGEGTITVALPGEILFAPGKATLKASSIATINKIANVIKTRYPGKQVIVTGHTDNDPIKKTRNLWKDNWELSCERALAVLRQLEKAGVPGELLRAVGRSMYQPRASNATAAGKAKNRRVEITIVKG